MFSKKMKYKRVLLKLSGEALAGDDNFGINAKTVADIARQIKNAKELGVEIAIVCGGGNIWRGKTGAEMGMERSSADYMGLLATVMTLACGLLTKERLKPVRAEKFSFKQFGDLFRNRPWIYLTLIGICTNFFNGFRYAVAGYMLAYCLGGDITIGSLIINYTVFMAFGEVTCMIFGGLSPAFTAKVGSKRMAFIYASIICVACSVLFFFIPMDASYIWLMIVVVVLTSAGIGLYSPLLWSMYADVADYATEKNGASSTGLIFSSGTMSQKLGGAISGSLIALFLGLAGASMMKDDFGNSVIDPASITDSVLTMVWSLFSLIPAGIAIIMALLAWLYPIKK